MKRIEYAGSVHDEEEIEAVVSVLRGGPTALRIGKNVKEMEKLVAASFGKRRGVMVNSGSSALYIAVELLGLEPGDEIITSSVTFSTDIAPMVRAGLVPVFVDVEPDTYQIDVEYKLGFKLVEVPITFTDRTEGVSKMSKGIFKEAFWGVLQMRFKKVN